MAISDYYKQTVTFKRFDSSVDALGAPDYSSDNYDDLFTDIACLLRPLGATEKISRGKTVSDRLFIIYCANMAIRESDIAVINGTTYTITGFKNSNSLSHHLEIECEEAV